MKIEHFSPKLVHVLKGGAQAVIFSRVTSSTGTEPILLGMIVGSRFRTDAWFEETGECLTIIENPRFNLKMGKTNV